MKELASNGEKLGFWARQAAEIDSIMERDPAARSRVEVILCYPSFQAMLLYRLAHFFWVKEWRLIGRYISYLARWLTGIEIHPGAEIGKSLFIDHGMGTVIGEASVIGDNVTLYHGVTLGGVAPSVDSDSQRSVKRHPTIQDHVIIGSGASVLGPVIVGRCARIGSNAVVVKDVPENTTVGGIPARPIGKAKADATFSAYGTPIGDDWQSHSEALLEHIKKLEARIKKLESNIKD